MSGRRFGRLPNWWSRSANGDDFLLMSLKSNDTGTGIAAMKCLLALSVLIDFHSRIAEVSLSGMEELTGLSRPMVIRGLNGEFVHTAQLGANHLQGTQLHG